MSGTEKHQYFYETIYLKGCKRDMCGLFRIVTNVGYVDGTVECREEIADDKLLARYVGERFEANSVTEKKRDIYIRRDTFKNISDEAIFLNQYFYRFAFEKDDVEVYSQQSGWMPEPERLCW